MKIGILGGGQLARMLADAAKKIGIETVCIDPDIECSAKFVTEVLHCKFDEVNQIINIFSDVDCVTYETENLPYAHVEQLAEKLNIVPDINALRITQDRLFEKELFNSLNIPAPEYYAINSWKDLKKAIDCVGFPCVLKTRRSGYDGKGQAIIRSMNDAEFIWKKMHANNLILEKFVPYDFEVSIIAASSKSGDIQFYPLTKNEHQNGILRISQAPYPDKNLETSAQHYARIILERFNYIGVMAIEFFCVNGSLIANEIAPRVHNSGHWSIEGAETSQFENHLRAIVDLPLGSTTTHCYSAMINCIGKHPENLDALRKLEGVQYHSYDKTARDNRKLGHVTICAESIVTLQEILKSSISYLS